MIKTNRIRASTQYLIHNCAIRIMQIQLNVRLPYL